MRATILTITGMFYGLLAIPLCVQDALALPKSAAVIDDQNHTGAVVVHYNYIGRPYSITVGTEQFKALGGVNLPAIKHPGSPFEQPKFSSVIFTYESATAGQSKAGIDDMLEVVVQTEDGFFHVGGLSTKFNTASATNPHRLLGVTYWIYQTPGASSPLWSAPFQNTKQGKTAIAAAIIYAGDVESGTATFGTFAITGKHLPVIFLPQPTSVETDTEFNFGG